MKLWLWIIIQKLETKSSQMIHQQNRHLLTLLLPAKNSKSIFTKKKSSVNLQMSLDAKDDTVNESDLKKDTNCDVVAMSTTEAAIRHPQDVDMESVGENVELHENSGVLGKSNSEMDVDSMLTQKAGNNETEKESEDETSRLSEATSVSVASAKKSLPFNQPRSTNKSFKMDSQEVNSGGSSQDCSLISEASTTSVARSKKSDLPFNQPRTTNKSFKMDSQEVNSGGSSQDCSLISEASAVSVAHSKKSNLPFKQSRRTNKSFEVDFEDTNTGSSSAKSTSESQSTDSGKEKNSTDTMQHSPIISSQDETVTFSKPARPFSRPLRKKRNDKFNVSFEETDMENNSVSSVNNAAKKAEEPGNDGGNAELSGDEEMAESAPSSQEETECNVKRSTIFNKRNKRKADFEVNFEETGTESNNASSGNNSLRDEIREESGRLSEDEVSPIASLSPPENISVQRNVKRSTLFNKRNTKKADFQVDFEDTGSGSNNVSNADSTLKDEGLTKTPRDNSASESPILTRKADLKRKSLFVRISKKNIEKSFNVPFEQTITAAHSTSDRSINESINISKNAESNSKKSKEQRKTILFQKKKKDEDDPFNVSCNETNSFTNTSKNDSLRRKAIFGKKKKTMQDTWDVGYEDSQTVEDGEDGEDEVTGSSLSPKNSFSERSSSSQPVTSSEGISKNNRSLENSAESPVSSMRMASTRSSARNSSYSFSDRSRLSSRNATVIDKTQKSIKKTPDVSRSMNSSAAQSSFNDDNLNGWMSDHSDESEKESEVETVPIAVIPPPAPLKEKLPSNNVQKIVNWEQKFKDIVEKAEKVGNNSKKKSQPLPVKKKVQPNSKNSPKARLKKPAPYATRRLYKFLIDKLEPKFGIDATIRAEELVVDLCETFKIVTRRKTYQKKIINDLKMDMAKLGIVETTWDFYNFIRDFLPESFRNKSIPKIQAFTCEVWPPQDVADPFEKIL